MHNSTKFVLSGTVTTEDFLKYYYFHTCRQTWWIVALVLAAWFGGGILALAAAIRGERSAAIDYGVPFFVMLPFFALGLIVLPRRAAKKYLASNASVQGPVTYTFSEQAIREESQHSSSELNWTALWKIQETGSLFLIYTGTLSAYLVPKRFFRDTDQQTEWHKLVEQQIAPKRIVSPGFFARRW